MTAKDFHEFRVSLEVSCLKSILNEPLHAVLDWRIHFALPLRVGGIESSASTSSISADHLVLLKDYDGRAVLQCLSRSSKASTTSTDYDHVGLHVNAFVALCGVGDFACLKNRESYPRLLQAFTHSREECTACYRCAADSITGD